MARDTKYIPYEQCQSVVNYIWEQMGWQYPPRIRPLHKNTTKYAGKADRTSVYIPEDKGAKTTVLIHELAHSATSTVDEGSERHGPEFVGVYMRMLDKLVPGLNLLELMYTAGQAKVKFDLMHIPNILDQ